MRYCAALGVLALGPMAGEVRAQALTCATAEIQADMTACAQRAWQLADQDLNLGYSLARTKMKSTDNGLPEDQRGAEAALRQAQRSWITFRDQACAAEGWRSRGGSIEPMVIYACRERLTRARTEDLRLIGETN